MGELHRGSIGDGPDAPDTDFEAAVEAFLRTIGAPERVREARLATALVDVEQQRVAGPQGQIAAWRSDDGPAALLVHGWQDDTSLWSPLIDVLRERRRPVVAFDLPAHGFSDGEWALTTEVADAIHAVVGALGPVDAILTHSMAVGGAVLAMAEGMHVDRAVFVAPPLRAGRHERWWRYAQRRGTDDAVVRAAIARYEERIGAARAGFDFYETLGDLDLEVLVVHSRDDERNPYEGSASLVPGLRHGELFSVDGLTHRKTARDPSVVDRAARFLGAV